jgi:hypothetical protein
MVDFCDHHGTFGHIGRHVSNIFNYIALDFYKNSKACLGGYHEGSAC